MKPLVAVITTMITIQSCHVAEPSRPTVFSVQVNDAALVTPNRFQATAVFSNDLGREANILTLGCQSQPRDFMPGFTLERLTGDKWSTFAVPLCVDLATGFTPIRSGNQLSRVEALNIDSLPAGSYRMRFDIRESDLTTKLADNYLLTNTFVIAH